VASDIRLVVFDLGRVLVRICSGWREAFERAGIDPGFRELEERQRLALRELVFANEIGQLTKAEFCRSAGELFDVPVADVSAMSDVYLLGIFPGVHELIDNLHGRGLQTACLSNTNDSHWRMMSDPLAPCCLPLEKLTHRFGSHLIGLRKPNPAIYEHVERVVQLHAAQIVFFDDLSENVSAAAARGWHAHQITSPDDPVSQMRGHLNSHGVL